ncbi:MAG: murein transglycosylase [Gammaproteobacteria bacterium]|nr:murein transglycosylase [Gammaproteobacteria bacterium]
MKNILKIFTVLVISILALWFYTKKTVNVQPPPRIQKPSDPVIKSSSSRFIASRFHELPNWEKADVLKSFFAFKASCHVWSKMEPSHRVGSEAIPMTAKDWLPICTKAESLPKDLSELEAKRFFETYFAAYHWKSAQKGRFTGYYAPIFKGSLVKTKEYSSPVYAAPEKERLIHSTRKQIYNGVLKGRAKVIAWLKSPIDEMALEIEGSGVIDLGKNKHIYVNYHAENGHKYRSMAQLLINSGIIKRSNASMTKIKDFFTKHPGLIQKYVFKNPSFVFFSTVSNKAFPGAQGAKLTPKYSMAVDRRYIPLGTPLFLSTKRPIDTKGSTEALNRVMIAQDTGGAIRGPIRGDIYWGVGERATKIASLMSNQGDYWLLLPRSYHFTK